MLFRPGIGFVGDVIPFADHDTIWLFYLLDTRDHEGMPWALVSTRDFTSYVDHGVVLPSGGPEAEDTDCYTGSVVHDGGRLHLFYTGHNASRRTPRGDLQVVCHAVSDGDLTRWTKQPQDTFGAPDGYAPEDWRDPFVYRPQDDGPWLMVLAARRENGPDRRRGVVARLTSSDLVTWTPTEPLWDPRRYVTQECPDVFRWGAWWYLVYSEFSDAFQTRYRVSDSPNGPWQAPARDTVDGRAFYAAKTVEFGGERFFVGWIATREGDRDDGAWQWAGHLAALQARQEPDGTLGFGLPHGVVEAFGVTHPLAFVPLDGASALVGDSAWDRYASWIGPTLPSECLLGITVDIADGTRACGVIFHASEDGESGYAIRLEPHRHRVVFDRWPRSVTGPAQWQIEGDSPHFVELERDCPLAAGEHTIQLLLEGTVAVAVIDGRVALTTRCYDHLAGRVGLFVTDGAITLVEATVSTRR